MDDRRVIGEKLAQLRTSRGETLESVAEHVGVSYVSMSRYENGKRMPKIDILSRIADYYGISLDSITGRRLSSDLKKTISSDLPDPEFPDYSAYDVSGVGRMDQPAGNGGLDEGLIRDLIGLSPAEVARVRDFVAGLRASREV